MGTLLNRLQDWWDEHEFYDYATRSCSGVCGHYTQMVWANTRYVGCGYAHCPAGTIFPQASTFVVCNYYPAGNFFNRDPYTAGTPCTNCEPDRLECDGSQCGGCMAPAEDWCDDNFGNCDQFAQSCPPDCNPSSTDTFCTGCRETCCTCTPDMLQPEATCAEFPGHQVPDGLHPAILFVLLGAISTWVLLRRRSVGPERRPVHPDHVGHADR